MSETVLGVVYAWAIGLTVPLILWAAERRRR